MILKKDYRSLGIVLLGFILFIFGFVYCYMRDPVGIFFPILYLCAISIISLLVVLARHLIIKKYKVRAGIVLVAICIISFGVLFMMYDIRDKLWMAARKGDLIAVKHFIENGADTNSIQTYVNARDMDYWHGKHTTALMEASYNGHLEVIKYLVENGADVNSGDWVGNTALMITSLDGRLEVIKYLVEKGADVSAQNNNGNTALMNASYRGYLEAVQYLVEKGADTHSIQTYIHAKNNEGETALDIAKKYKHKEVVEYLESLE